MNHLHIERAGTQRDAHAATQHIMHALPNYELAGREMLGLDPGTPMV